MKFTKINFFLTRKLLLVFVYNDLKFVQEDQLVRVLEKNTELTIQNKDLQKQVQRLQNVSIYYIYIEFKWV